MDAHGAHYSSFDWPNQSTTRNRFMGSPPRGAGNGSAKGKSNGAHGVGSTPPPSASSMVSQTAPTQRATSASPGSLASSPSRPVSPPQLGLLVPTDRPLDEFEDKWLPRLGRLRVDREVHMKGYALYGIRGWYLSRTHWAATIAAYTGKPTEFITCYVLVPAPGLSPKAGAAELASAVQYLAGETRAQPRKTEHGTLLVTTPAGFGQDIAPIASGDLRETWPFIILNTALRRLGCGGRAAMGNDNPVAAVRRKFYESYRIPTPGSTGTLTGAQSRAASPTQSPMYPVILGHARSPSSNTSGSPGTLHRGRQMTVSGQHVDTDTEQTTPAALMQDPLMLNVVELVKLIQGALAVWGLYGTKHEDIEIDGLLCDETKAGIFAWRRNMGMEREESLRLEKETSGGCIDPRTLSALLSSVTSTRYKLDALGVEKIPKDPFSSPRRFLQAWRTFQATCSKQPSMYMSVAGICDLNSAYVSERRGHATDAFKVHRVLLSGVASAASGMHATLKGDTSEGVAPLRKREQHLRFSSDRPDSGVDMIIPGGEVGSIAAPDVITTGLEPYIKGVLRSREKDWDIMGARRVAELWNGTVGDIENAGPAQSRLRVFSRKSRGPVRDIRDEDEDDSGVGNRMTIRGVSNRAGTKLKDFGRRAARIPNETSDSEAGRNGSKPPVPLVVEPDNAGDRGESISRSPSPAVAPRSIDQHATSPSRPGLGQSPLHSVNSGLRLSVATNLSGDISDVPSVRSRSGSRGFDPTARFSSAVPLSGSRNGLAMLRTVSDGADVVLDDRGHEWVIVNAYGTGKREDTEGREINTVMPDVDIDTVALKRTNSLQDDRSQYRHVHVNAPEHLAVDVDLCESVWKLKKHERLLAKRADEMALLERSAFQASHKIWDTIRARRNRLRELEEEVRDLQAKLNHASSDAVDEDRALQWASSKLLFFLSEDTNTHELNWGLRELERQWEALRDEHDTKLKDTIRNEEGRSWWRFGL